VQDDFFDIERRMPGFKECMKDWEISAWANNINALSKDDVDPNISADNNNSESVCESLTALNTQSYIDDGVDLLPPSEGPGFGTFS
jgi:hypothetical protein